MLCQRRPDSFYVNRANWLTNMNESNTKTLHKCKLQSTRIIMAHSVWSSCCLILHIWGLIFPTSEVHQTLHWCMIIRWFDSFAWLWGELIRTLERIRSSLFSLHVVYSLSLSVCVWCFSVKFWLCESRSVSERRFGCWIKWIKNVRIPFIKLVVRKNRI